VTEIRAQAALWPGFALVATLMSIWLRVATALSEIVVGTITHHFIGPALGSALLASEARWIELLFGAGTIVLAFLQTSLDPQQCRRALPPHWSRPIGGP
jgi:hypothetical protein